MACQQLNGPANLQLPEDMLMQTCMHATHSIASTEAVPSQLLAGRLVAVRGSHKGVSCEEDKVYAIVPLPPAQQAQVMQFRELRAVLPYVPQPGKQSAMHSKYEAITVPFAITRLLCWCNKVAIHMSTASVNARVFRASDL